jgi:hypothetical protein
MDPALASLIGVAVGAAATTGTQAVAARRRNRLAIRAAALLIGEELSRNSGLVMFVLGQGEWPPAEVVTSWDFDTSAWDEHKASLALADETDAWMNVAGAYQRLRTFGALSAIARIPGTSLGDGERKSCEETLKQSEQAGKSLRRLA